MDYEYLGNVSFRLNHQGRSGFLAVEGGEPCWREGAAAISPASQFAIFRLYLVLNDPERRTAVLRTWPEEREINVSAGPAPNRSGEAVWGHLAPVGQGTPMRFSGEIAPGPLGISIRLDYSLPGEAGGKVTYWLEVGNHIWGGRWRLWLSPTPRVKWEVAIAARRPQLAGVDLRSADLRNQARETIVLRGANLAGANLSNGKYIADLTEANLTGADCRNTLFFPDTIGTASLKNATFDRAQMAGARLLDLVLDGTKFRSVNFSDSRFFRTRADGAVFDGADLRGVARGPGLELRFYTGDSPRPGLRKTSFVNAKIPFHLLGRDWSLLDLTGAEFTELPTDLSGLQAMYSVLTGLDLRNRNLTNANFTGSILKGVKFDGADLSGANVTGADLCGCDLSRAIAARPLIASTDPENRTQMRGATFQAGLFGKRWTALDLTCATIRNLEKTDLTGMDARDALLDGVDLSNANFNPATIDGVKTPSRFDNAWFKGAGLQGTQFGDAELSGAQFGAHGCPKADPAIPPDVKYADLSDAYLVGANLTDANFENVTANRVQIYIGDSGERPHLAGAPMICIKLAQANLAGADLDNADLRGAILTNANLTQTILTRAKLQPHPQTRSESDLQGAFLAGADFTDAKLQGANLTGALVSGPDGVYMFSLPSALADALDASVRQDLHLDIRKAFDSKSVRLASGARLVSKERGRWILDNESTNPQNIQPAYVLFTIVPEGDALAVFCTMMRVQRLGPNRRIDPFLQTLSEPTKGLDIQVMTDSTTLPNGRTLGKLQRDGVQWDPLWLRVREPPKPPKCTPTPDSYCDEDEEQE